jgi:hypothetical protein
MGVTLFGVKYMDQEMYPVILQEMVHSLKISKEDLEADIQDITEYWETCLDKANITNRDTAILILTTCVSCYLKGRNIDLENDKSIAKNNSLLLTLVTLIPLYAWTRPVDNYPRIHKLIPRKTDSPLKPAKKNDILSQAEDILREKWSE